MNRQRSATAVADPPSPALVKVTIIAKDIIWGDRLLPVGSVQEVPAAKA